MCQTGADDESAAALTPEPKAKAFGAMIRYDERRRTAGNVVDRACVKSSDEIESMKRH